MGADQLDPSLWTVDPALRRGRARLRVVAAVFSVLFIGVALRLVDMTPSGIFDRPAEAAPPGAALGSPPPRPDLLDRNGQLLAIDLHVPSVYADPRYVRDPERTARTLAKRLSGVDGTRLARDLARAKQAGRRWVWIKHQIDPREEKAILEMGLPGVHFERAAHRVYPRTHMASHLLGFVDIENYGISGIDRSLEPERAIEGTSRREPDGALAGLRDQSQVALSIDLRVQHIVQDELANAMRRFRPKGACAIVMDIRTGELVAMASMPDFDPNHMRGVSTDQRRNRCVSDTYELGSVFKVVSHAMALDSGKVRLSDKFDVASPLRFSRQSIGDDHKMHRPVSVSEVFKYSSNIGTAKMAMQAGGGEAMKAFLVKIGLTERSTVEIPGVLLHGLPRRWPDVTTATVSFGHGIMVSPLQYAEMAATLLGDGRRVRATVLRRDGPSTEPRERVISAKTVEDLRWMMWLTVADGTGTKARVPGYNVGGKTGTADKAEHGVYRKDAVVASFVGVFPIEAPRYVTFVMLDEPKGDKESYGFRYGGWTVAPVVGAIIGRMGPVVNLPPSRPGSVAGYEERLRAMKAQLTAQQERSLASVAAGR